MMQYAAGDHKTLTPVEKETPDMAPHKDTPTRKRQFRSELRLNSHKPAFSLDY